MILSISIFRLLGPAPLPRGVMDCSRIQNRDNCGELCVTDGWYSKVTFTLAVNAKQICIDQGYNGEILEYGGNSQVQCKYPGPVYGNPYKIGGKLDSSGRTVSWRCEGRPGKRPLNYNVHMNIYMRYHTRITLSIFIGKNVAIIAF